MNAIIDLEIGAPKSEIAKTGAAIYTGRPGTPFTESLERPEGYGFSNYGKIFRSPPVEESDSDDGGMEALVADMDKDGVEYGLLVNLPNSEIGRIHREYPNRFKMFATLDPFDGMRAVREFERLVRDDGANGLRLSALYNCVPANDRRYYPLYAKCVELGVPVRIYTSMSYANDRPYDLGHPRYLDDVAIDFPELKIIAGLAGWPWITDMVGLLRRHPNLYCDTSAHRPRYFGQAGSGWDMFLQFGNSLLQDKVMIGLSRYLFGCSYDELIEEYQQLPIKEKVMEKWLYGNAERFFSEDNTST
jgi:predicted TIM-barrel fold metal-dependent hydrolase